MRRARELAKTLVRKEDRMDDIVVFGSDAQAAVSQITKDMMAGVRVGTLDEVIQLSDGVLAQIQTLDIGDLSPAARRILFVLRESTADIERRIRISLEDMSWLILVWIARKRTFSPRKQLPRNATTRMRSSPGRPSGYCLMPNSG